MISNATLLSTFIFVEAVQTSGQACRFLGYQVDMDPSSLLSSSNYMTSRECFSSLTLFPHLESGNTTTYLKIYRKSMSYRK